MYNVNQKTEIVNTFTENADDNIKQIQMLGSLKESMEIDDAEMAKLLINKLADAIRAAVPEGIDVPDVTLYTSMSGTDSVIRVIDLIVRNKYSSTYEFKFKKQFVLCDTVFEDIADFLKCSYVELVTDVLVNANLDVVNSKLEEICKEAKNDFKVAIVSPLSHKGKKIVSITDKEVTFVADEERVLDLDDILVFCEPSELVTEEMIAKALEDEVALYAQAQTTPQFVGVHDPLVEYICGISKLVKPFTLIKKVYSKNVAKLRGNKETLAYWHEGELYSVLSVNADGKEVVLKPFSTNTLEVADVDVLAKI